jgi:hypothetical protein
MMNAQAAPSTYTPAGGMQAPTGGLPMLANPMAQQLQGMGRDEDSMLVHMSPEEVNSLQGLAMAAGGSLTINPQTGLPEAFSLKKLLPTLLGVGLAATGIGAPLAAGIIGAGQTALTGNLQKGLMAGLGAFGGASLAGAAGIGGAISKNAFGALGDKAGVLGANMGAGTATAGAAPALGKAAEGSVQAAFDTQFGVKPTGFLGKFGETARQGLPGGVVGKAAPFAAGMGLLSGISDATTPGFKAPGGQIDNSYQGPYTMQRREAQFAPSTEDLLSSSKQRRYFENLMPEVRNAQGQVVSPGTTTAPGTMIYQNLLNPRAKKGEPMYSSVGTPFMGLNPEEEGRFAEGGAVNMRDGSFVIDARTVSEIGNGSSNAGIEALSRMGGRPVQGPGDGVSDSVKASIGGKQEARVARDEVIFPPEAVRRVGGGSEARGTKKLYALMDKAHKARKKASRGQDTKVRRGLA